MEIYKVTEPKDWEFFAKGNANIIFSYRGSNDYLKQKLLRLRLSKDEEQYISTCELYDFIELKCRGMFGLQMIHVQLMVLTKDFVENLNSEGNKIEMTERYALLIPNILDKYFAKYALSKHCCQLFLSNGRQKDSNLVRNSQISDLEKENMPIDSVTFEIKPKWLYDNTSTRYCRTCLYNQLRGYPRHFCPLDLLYDETIDQGLDDIFSAIPPALLERIHNENGIPIKQLFRIFLANPKNVFQKLKQFQKINSHNEVIDNLTDAKDVLPRLSLIMTLRDVGLFIKFEKYDKLNDAHNSYNNVNNLIDLEGYGKFLLTCNIYDLDLKSKFKYRHWIEIEQKLQSIYNSTNSDWRNCVRI